MPVYRVCGLTLKSNIPLPELPQAGRHGVDCTFHLLPARELEPGSGQPFHTWELQGGEVWLSFEKRGPDYLLRFPDWADFLLPAGGMEVRCYPVPDTPLETIRHLFLNQVLPLALSRRGKFLLHASAVVGPTGAIAFLGRTGLGKSTLAASFVKEGFSLLTDDCLLVEEQGGRPVAHPSYPGVRLWDDVLAVLPSQAEVTPVAHYTKKKRLLLDHTQPHLQPEGNSLRRVYLLAPAEAASSGPTVSITPLPPRVAFIELASHAYKVDITDRSVLRQEFELLSRLVMLPLFACLTFPRDLALLPTVHEAILADLGGSAT
jgi:hypothetical protein